MTKINKLTAIIIIINIIEHFNVWLKVLSLIIFFSLFILYFSNKQYQMDNSITIKGTKDITKEGKAFYIILCFKIFCWFQSLIAGSIEAL